jgi:hypothetical protein
VPPLGGGVKNIRGDVDLSTLLVQCAFLSRNSIARFVHRRAFRTPTLRWRGHRSEFMSSTQKLAPQTLLAIYEKAPRIEFQRFASAGAARCLV